MDDVRIGIIGGSGLYEIPGLEDVQEVFPDTPFGKPSDAIVVARLGNVPLAFLPRHGRGHRLLPTEVPSRANIAALKLMGVQKILSFSAVGSLREEIRASVQGNTGDPSAMLDTAQEAPVLILDDGARSGGRDGLRSSSSCCSTTATGWSRRRWSSPTKSWRRCPAASTRGWATGRCASWPATRPRTIAGVMGGSQCRGRDVKDDDASCHARRRSHHPARPDDPPGAA